MAELSPMMRQYNEIKAQNEDTILFFRVGDFYEMFFEDAKKASEELDLVLTGKECGLEERAPMCGVPFHSCEAYIARLVEKGYKVAICEQVEDPATAKGLVKRDIVRGITPGTVLEDSMLDEGRNNYLASICMGEGEIGLCFTDASTGECHATALSEENFQTRLIDEIARFSPREILIGEDFNLTAPTVWDYLQQSFEGMLTVREKTSFNLAHTEELILKHFNVISVENIGLQKNGAATAAFGATLQYLYETGVNGQVSVNEIDLYTGRTHQIRAHMAYLGMPVLGDSKYGDNNLNRHLKLKYQLLCSCYLKLGYIEKEKYSYLSFKEFNCPAPWFVESFKNRKL